MPPVAWIEIPAFFVQITFDSIITGTSDDTPARPSCVGSGRLLRRPGSLDALATPQRWLELDRDVRVPNVFPGGPVRSTLSRLIDKYSSSTELHGFRTSFRKPVERSLSSIASSRKRCWPNAHSLLVDRHALSPLAHERLPEQRSEQSHHATMHLRKAQGTELRSDP